MFEFLKRSFDRGIVTDPGDPGEPRGFAVHSDEECRRCGDCGRVCPTGAIFEIGAGPNPFYCIACGRCIQACSSGALRWSEEPLPPAAPSIVYPNDSRLLQRLRSRSLHIRHLDAGSCNACDFELSALLNPVYDIQRLGFDFVASPRHADIILVTGPVTRNMEAAVRLTYEAAPEPKVVIACGACASHGGGVKGGYTIVGRAEDVLPVAVRVPGCPPRPQELIQALIAARHIYARLCSQKA